jgi:hypothetical protein
MKLNWRSLRPYSALADPEAEGTSAGVFVWGFLLDGRFVPYWVGKALDVHWRLSEHLSRILGGEQTVYHKDHLVQFWKFEPVYGEISPARKVDFVRNRYGSLREHIDAMIDSFHFTWAPIPREDFEQWASSAARAVMDAIGRDQLVNRRAGAPERPVEVGNLLETIGRD